MANFKEMSINKFIAFKITFFLLLSLYSSFSLFLLSFLIIPTALLVHTGKQDFLLYRKGFISATWRQARGGISSVIQAREGQTDHVTYYTETCNHTGLIKYTLQTVSHTHSSYSFLAHTTQASLFQFKMSPEHNDKMLGSVNPMLSGAQEEQCLEQNPSQTNTGLHQSFPQTSTHFSVPVLGFFFFLPQTHTNTHIYTYERRAKMYTPQNIPRKRPFLPFCLTSVVFLMFISLSSRQRGACLLRCPSQSELYWRRIDRIEPGD